MPQDFAGLLIVLLSFVVTFTVARTLSRWMKKRKGEKDEAARRAGESRQVRRARERRAK